MEKYMEACLSTHINIQENITERYFNTYSFKGCIHSKFLVTSDYSSALS